jgi:hypothetical protein
MSNQEIPAPAAEYKIRGLGRVICWLSAIALIPLLIGTVTQFRLIKTISDLLKVKTFTLQNEIATNATSLEETEVNSLLVAWVLGLAAFILLIVWSWRATENVKIWANHYGHKELKRGSGWAFWGWFVPIVNLWFPYQIVKQAWERGPFDNTFIQNSKIETLWFTSWLIWVISNFADRIIIGRWNNDETLEEIRSTYILEGANNLLLLLGAVCFILTIEKISNLHAGYPPLISQKFPIGSDSLDLTVDSKYPAGWHPVPNSDQERYWDGSVWTDAYRPK